MNSEIVLNFIRERHAIFLKRQEGRPPPWTDDPILREYRFCNVYRELDKVTLWINHNWRRGHWADPDVWFALVVARFINHPATLAEIGYPVPFSPKNLKAACARRREAKEQVFTGAYIVHADIKSIGVPKPDYLADKVFAPLWKARGKVRPGPDDTLQSFFDRLRGFHDMGSFMAAQVVADTKFTMSLTTAKDWWTFAASGPGSKRGLNRVMGRDVKSPWREEEWHKTLLELNEKLKKPLLKLGYPPLSASDCQNVMCEIDKYERVRLGEGRPRAKYRPPVTPAPTEPELFP